jgi:hypothetical protein
MFLGRLLSAVSAMTACAGLAGCSDPEPSGHWLGTIASIENPTVAGSRYPNLAKRDGSSVVMSWLQPTGSDRHALQFATWSDGSWSDPRTVVEGAGWFVNWADFPSVVPLAANTWAAHWLEQRPGSVYSYDVRMVVSSDAGINWSEPMSPHTDGTPTEHGFVSLFGRDGAVEAVWLDGRHTGGGHDHATAGAAESAGAMTLRGAVIGSDGRRIGDDMEIDRRVCDCCQTDVAITDEGLVVVYRDRGEGEVRDIAIVRREAGGWSLPVFVHEDRWRIDACPVNGPAVDARGQAVAVAWFTAPDQPRVRLAFSSDGGRSFGPPVEVASGGVAGRVDIVLLADRLAVVSWLQSSAGGAEIRAQPFTPTASAGPVVVVAATTVQRSSGFPQMVRAGRGLMFAWTDSGESPRVRTAWAELR